MEGLDIMTFHKHTEIIDTNGKSLKNCQSRAKVQRLPGYSDLVGRKGCTLTWTLNTTAGCITLKLWQVFCCAFGRILHITGRILIIRTRKLRALFGTTFVCAGAHNNHDKSPEFRILETVLRLDKHGLRI